MENKKTKIIVISFICGCVLSAVVTGFFVNRHGSGTVGELDRRHAEELRGAVETIGRLDTALLREREINRELREHNNRAREIAEGLTGTAERNVRNLQEAVGLIREIREKVKVLAGFYGCGGAGGGGPGGMGGG